MTNDTAFGLPSSDTFAALFEALPGSYVLLQNNAPVYTVLMATPEYLRQTGYQKDAITGKGIFEISPKNPHDQTDTSPSELRKSLDFVRLNKVPYHLPVYRYDITGENGNFSERYWKADSRPVFASDGTVAYILHSAKDITSEVEAKQTEVRIENPERLLNHLIQIPPAEESEISFRQNEQDLQTMVLEAPIGICVMDATTLISEIANDKFLEIAGRPINEVVGWNYWETFSEARPYYEDALKKVVQDGITFTANEVEVPLIRHSKRESSIVTFVYAPLKNSEGLVKKVAVWVLDNTAQVAARKEVQESAIKFRSLVEEMPIATCLFAGRNMVIEMANDAMIEVWGKGSGVIGKPLGVALPELKNQHFLSLLDELYSTGEPYSAKGGRADLVVNGQLKTFYFDYDFKPIINAEGATYAILETAIDVTEHVLAQKKIEASRHKLAQSERNFRNVILQSPVAMCILMGPEYIVEIANERIFEVWGKTASEVMNKPIFEGLPEAAAQGLEDLLLKVFTTGESFKALERPVNLPRNGKIETTYLNFVYEPFYGDTGNITGIIAVAIEVTEQVLARQKIEEVVTQRTSELATTNKTLQSINIELQRSNQNLEEFAHVASHDLKEPVRKIRNFSDRLKTELGEGISEKAQTFLSKIDSAAARMFAMINGVLLYSSTGAGEQPEEQVNLNQIFENIESDLELAIIKAGAKFNYQHLPTITGSSVLLYQLFYNLVSNSLKFAAADRSLLINVGAEKIETPSDIVNIQAAGIESYKIMLADNGIGFDQSQAIKIFQTFSRLHAQDTYEGTGLGLALCKKIVERHGGTITAEGKEGEGTVFTIILPE